MYYIKHHVYISTFLVCNEFFYWLAFDLVSWYEALSRSDTWKAELELLTGTVTKPVDRRKQKFPCAVSIFRLFKGVCFKRYLFWIA